MDLDHLDPYEIPLINTVLLLSSASAVTVTHHCINCYFSKTYDNKLNTKYCILAFLFLIISIILVILFLLLQYIEYIYCTFDISDSVFGSVFYMGTTLHGLHVLVAAFWLSVTLLRMVISEQ